MRMNRGKVRRWIHWIEGLPCPKSTFSKLDIQFVNPYIRSTPRCTVDREQLPRTGPGILDDLDVTQPRGLVAPNQ